MKNRIRELRKQRKLSQGDLANILHLSQSAVTHYENGRRNPDAETLMMLANFFGVTVDYLTCSTDVANKPILVKIYGEVAAGKPIDQIENELGHAEISADMAKCGTYFGLRIKGDSMSPRIQNGDIVIVRQQPTIENGEIAIVSIAQDTATCKKIKKTDKGISLIGLNTSFEPLYYTWQEVAELPVTILGKVVELRAKL
ncbi:helix-turn-helix domain-containing protein [bacterium]|nr:helix-turn-helix domain-containing protein [bacterium]